MFYEDKIQGASTYQAHACVTRTNIPPICYSKSYDQTQRQYGWRQHEGHEYPRYGLMGATKRNFLFTVSTFQKERELSWKVLTFQSCRHSNKGWGITYRRYCRGHCYIEMNKMTSVIMRLDQSWLQILSHPDQGNSNAVNSNRGIRQKFQVGKKW